jgi:two-component system nitrogen regulation sensor histidine kinase GlnL
MSQARTKPAPGGASFSTDPGAVLGALTAPVFVVDAGDRLAYVNLAAEQFFELGAAALLGRTLDTVLPGDSPILTLIRQVQADGNSVSDSGVSIETARTGARFVSIEVAPLGEAPDMVVVSLHERTIARQLDRQLLHRNAARSVSAMAALLAHERYLTRLICEETDRIVGLVDRMGMFADDVPIERRAVNIHEVLEHVRNVARSGFARDVRFTENYDPSLPPVYGNRDLLVQALLNLVKNAAEAVPAGGGQIALTTRYRQGVRLAVPGGESRVDLPLEVCVQDSGPGVPDHLRAHLFDAFVTSKAGGRGLGLALVAKVVGDHGGVIAFDSEPGRTVFRLMLPADRGEAGQT